MSLRRVEAAVRAYFADAGAAATAAVAEVQVAATYPDAAEAVRLQFGGVLTVPQAVLVHAIRRGEIWAGDPHDRPDLLTGQEFV